ncbi:MAG: metal-sensing transcriptional repressor [Eubacterium sp.]|nr:metal-sensing transcriptional repressor [Eubacterium sp.]
MSEHHTHHHNHDHKHTKEVSNRLARAIGHLQKVKQMVDDGEDCSEVLVQLAAVKSAINNTGKLILKDHLEHCIVHAVQDGDDEMLEELNNCL